MDKELEAIRGPDRRGLEPIPAHPRMRSIEDGRRVARQALGLLECIPPWMAQELTTEFFRAAKWRAEINLALVLDAIARDERPKSHLSVVGRG